MHHIYPITWYLGLIIVFHGIRVGFEGSLEDFRSYGAGIFPLIGQISESESWGVKLELFRPTLLGIIWEYFDCDIYVRFLPKSNDFKDGK